MKNDLYLYYVVTLLVSLGFFLIGYMQKGSEISNKSQRTRKQEKSQFSVILTD